MGDGISVYSVDGFTVDGGVNRAVYVHDCGGNMRNAGKNNAGILTYSSLNGLITKCRVERIQPIGFFAGVDKIGYDIDAGCTNVVIDDCDATGCFNSGFMLFQPGNGCTIKNCRATENCWAGYSGFGEYCIQVPGGNPTIALTNNIAVNTRVYTGDPNNFQRNDSHGACGLSITGDGTFAGEISGNSFTLNHDIFGQTTPINARTNSSTFTPAVNIHDNIYHIQSGSVNFWWANAQYPSLAAWQAASGKGQGDTVG
jgi:hypothetical protein